MFSNIVKLNCSFLKHSPSFGWDHFWTIVSHVCIFCRYRHQRISKGWRSGPTQDDEGCRWPGLLHRGRSHRQTIVRNKGRELDVMLSFLILKVLTSSWHSCLVADTPRHRWGLGPDGEVHGADHLQVSAGRAWRPLLPVGEDTTRPPVLPVFMMKTVLTIETCASLSRRSLLWTRQRTVSTQLRSCLSPSTSRVSTSPFRCDS